MSSCEKKTATKTFYFLSRTCNSCYILGVEEKNIDIQINSCEFGISRLERGSTNIVGTWYFVLEGPRPPEKAYLEKFGKSPAYQMRAGKANVENLFITQTITADPSIKVATYAENWDEQEKNCDKQVPR